MQPQATTNVPLAAARNALLPLLLLLLLLLVLGIRSTFIAVQLAVHAGLGACLS